MTHTYTIEGMHCGSCISRVKDALARIAGISGVTVTLTPPQARVTMTKHIPKEVIRDAVSEAGDFTIVDDHKEIAPASIQERRTLTATLKTYYPLILIFSYILGGTLLFEYSTGTLNVHRAMNHFMAGFFLVFSFFKLLDLRGFAESYQMYDLVAQRIPLYAKAYPFIELLFGALYLSGAATPALYLATILVMGVGAIGVLRSILNKQKIRCACLGTVLNLPLGNITLFEDILMIVMPVISLILS